MWMAVFMGRKQWDQPDFHSIVAHKLQTFVVRLFFQIERKAFFHRASGFAVERDLS